MRYERQLLLNIMRVVMNEVKMTVECFLCRISFDLGCTIMTVAASPLGELQFAKIVKALIMTGLYQGHIHDFWST
jgi:hypothetical protein